MRATLNLPRRATYATYLAVERGSQHRHELIDGVIVAMAGGTPEHNAIGAQVALCVGNRLSVGCRYYSADQRYWIERSERARYADGSVICGRPERAGHDDEAATNPTLIVEVLSPSSEGDDEGEKRIDFQSLASLEAYVLVSQDARQVEVWRRGPEGSWPEAPEVAFDGDTFALPRLTSPIPVAQVYEGIVDAAGRSLLR
jgi:Uma2 family endonuclease